MTAHQIPLQGGGPPVRRTRTAGPRRALVRQVLKAGIVLSDHGVASVDEHRVARIGRHGIRAGQHDRVRAKVIAGAARLHRGRRRCDCFRALVYARDVKAVVIAGAGGNFSSGGDVHEIIGPLTRMAMPDLLAFTRMTGDLVKAMRACPQPIVAALDGVCVGAGAIIAMAPGPPSS